MRRRWQCSEKLAVWSVVRRSRHDGLPARPPAAPSARDLLAPYIETKEKP